MPSFPIANYLSDNLRNKGNMKTAFEDWLAKCKLLVGGSSITTYTISGGSITPNAPHFSIGGEGAASDDLTNIVTTNLDAGSVIEVKAESAAQVITIKNAAGGAGQITTRDGSDIVLNTTTQFVRLLQVSGNWTELSRGEKQATESVAGIAKAASIAITDALTSITDFVTPAGLAKHTPVGIRKVPVPASSFEAATTNGAAIGKVETTTNAIGVGTVWDFSGVSAQRIWFKFKLPKGINIAAGFKYKVVWRAESGSGGVAWECQALARRDGTAQDIAYGTAVVVTDTLGTAGNEQVTSLSGVVTPSGTPAAEDSLYIRVSRNPANASDTLAVNARLIAVEFEFTQSKGNDA